MYIRPFKKEDLDGIQEIEATTFQTPWPVSLFSYLEEKNPELFLVAKDEGKIIGYVVGRLREMLFSGVPHMSKIGHILNVVVDEEWRLQGIGTSLIREIEKKFKSMSVGQLILEVRETNSTAISFYKNLGFSEIGRVKTLIPDQDAIIMSKNFQ